MRNLKRIRRLDLRCPQLAVYYLEVKNTEKEQEIEEEEQEIEEEEQEIEEGEQEIEKGEQEIEEEDHLF